MNATSSDKIGCERKHAYLIAAHTNINQLRLLISSLDHKMNDIYLHVNIKSDINEEDVKDCVKYSKLYFIKKIAVSWGDYTLTEVVFELLKASTPNQYYYYHFITGMDLPLKNIDTVNRFYEDNEKKLGFKPEYVHFADNESTHTAIRCRLNDGRIAGGRIARMITRIMHLMHRIQYKCNPSIYGFGSSFFDITHDLAMCVLRHKLFIRSHFICFSCVDEHYLQTVINKYGYRDRCYLINDTSSKIEMTMRLIDFERGHDAHPYTFTIADREELINSPCLFARKFDERVDNDIIKCITEHIKE